MLRGRVSTEVVAVTPDQSVLRIARAQMHDVPTKYEKRLRPEAASRQNLARAGQRAQAVSPTTQDGPRARTMSTLFSRPQAPKNPGFPECPVSPQPHNPDPITPVIVCNCCSHGADSTRSPPKQRVEEMIVVRPTASAVRAHDSGSCAIVWLLCAPPSSTPGPRTVRRYSYVPYDLMWRYAMY